MLAVNSLELSMGNTMGKYHPFQTWTMMWKLFLWISMSYPKIDHSFKLCHIQRIDHSVIQNCFTIHLMWKLLTKLTKKHGFVSLFFFPGIGLHGIKPWVRPWIPWISYGDMVWGPWLSHPRGFSGIRYLLVPTTLWKNEGRNIPDLFWNNQHMFEHGTCG